MASNVKIGSQGITKILKNYNYKQAFAEYIWNGFDAGATTISVNYDANKIDSLNLLEISDNGHGIDIDKLKETFEPFFESEKAIEITPHKHSSTLHGKNGVGRLTFFTFCSSASWLTVCKNMANLKAGQITIEVEQLNNYQSTKIDSNNLTATGTTVRFSRFTITKAHIELEIIPFLAREFCWFLELNKNRQFKILINGKELDYTSNILDKEEFDFKNDGKGPIFYIIYVQWQESLLKEHSKFYFLNETGQEVFKDFTTLNRKGDHYYHSVYIKSDFFNGFDFKSNEYDTQINLFSKAKSAIEYRSLIKSINEFLQNKRKPFLKDFALQLIEEYEQNGILPKYKNEWDVYRKQALVDTIKGLYEVQPKLFASLNIEQKKTFVRLLDLLLDSNERENLFSIIEDVIDLESEEREDLCSLFKTTSLSRIIETIKMIEDRYKTFYMLKDLVFNPDLNADEIHHLQKVIELHYWFFGEQYHLVTAAEPKFEKALRRYHHLLYQEDVDKKLTHAHKNKEMDIFACRQNVHTDKIENIVVELKHPDINIGSKQYLQVDKYLQVILSEPEFNANNMSWEFYLIAKDFDSSGFLERQIESNANHGLKSLVHWHDKGRVKIFAKKWSEVFAEFEIRHTYLNKTLKLKRSELVNELKSANEVVIAMQNSAVQPKELSF